jgi:hypothetical protein
MVSLEFFIDISFRPHYVPGVDSACNRNEYQEYFLGDKGGRCVGLTNHLHVPAVLKSGSLNLLEPSGPVQACTGIGFICVVFIVHCNLCSYVVLFLLGAIWLLTQHGTNQ